MTEGGAAARHAAGAETRERALEARVAELEAANAALGRDIDRRREVEAALRTSEAALRQLIEAMPQIVWITRPDGWHVYYNRKWTDFTGLSLEESLGDGWNPAFHPDDQARAAARWADATRTGEPYEIEYRLRRADGTYRWMLGRAMPLRDGSGRIVKWFGTCTDIEEFKRAQSRIDLHADRLITTLESITDAFFTVDRGWRLTYVNRQAERALRRSRDELLGQDLWEAFPEAVGTILDEVYHRAMRTGVSEAIDEYYWQPTDAWLSIRAYPSEQGLAVYFLDDSEQHEAQQLLRQREAQLAQQAELLDEARDAIVVFDLEHRISYWNRSAERLYGVSAADAVGARAHDLPLGDGASLDDATATVLRRGAWAGEFTQTTREGTELVVEGRWSLVCNDDGQPASVLAIHSDVTERRRVEQQLLRTQRLESLGTLAGGIAHDLNNVLAPILLSVQVIRDTGPDPTAAEMLGLIEQSALRGAEMIRRVLSFARGVDGQRVELHLDRIVDDVVRIAGETFSKRIRITTDLAEGVPPVLGDATQLHQVLMNLCINARDAMPHGGTLRIGLDVATIDEQDLVTATVADADVAPGGYVVIRVEDEGTGMEQTTMQRLFEPFFTTKPHGAGTGLGLSTSHGIVRSHGGFIAIHSELGVGSRFAVHLPAATAGPAPAPDLGGDTVLAPGRGELVLVVEDEAATRATTRQVLEAAGYRVLEAEDGTQALARLERHLDDVALVMTDMMMPQLDGPATIRAVQQRRPDLPVVAVSGLISGPEVAEATSLGVQRVLSKPYSATALLTVVAEVLRG